MAAPNMATITASLERSFQNCSLNNNQPNSGADESSGSRVLGTGSRSSSTSSSTPHRNHHHHHHRHLQNANDTTLELNSHISLPYHWEQCLDLKVPSFLLSLFQVHAHGYIGRSCTFSLFLFQGSYLLWVINSLEFSIFFFKPSTQLHLIWFLCLSDILFGIQGKAKAFPGLSLTIQCNFLFNH